MNSPGLLSVVSLGYFGGKKVGFLTVQALSRFDQKSDISGLFFSEICSCKTDSIFWFLHRESDAFFSQISLKKRKTFRGTPKFSDFLEAFPGNFLTICTPPEIFRIFCRRSVDSIK